MNERRLLKCVLVAGFAGHALALRAQTPIAVLRRVCVLELVLSTRAKEDILLYRLSYADCLQRDLLQLGNSAPRVMRAAGRKMPNSALPRTDAVIQ